MTDDLIPIADNIWLFPHDPDRAKVQPSVGVVCSSTQTVLIDAGNGPLHARRILAVLDKINAPPISHVIYTHHHWDHVFGACALDARVVAHQLCYDELHEDAAKPWSREFLDEQLAQHPERAISLTAMQNAVDNWAEFRIVLPDETFTERWSLPLDGITLEVEHVGGFHALDSCVVRVKEAGVMFMGDSFYPIPGKQRMNWKLLNRLLIDHSITTFIHSHGAPIRPSLPMRWAVKVRAFLSRFSTR